MRISLLIFLFLHIAPLFSAELVKPTYKKSYTRKQLEKLARIKHEWEIYTMLIRRCHLMEDGIDKGLHPDDIYYGFVIDIVKAATHDPDEATLHKVEFLLQHNADPNADGVGSPRIWQRATINHAPTYAIAQCLINHKAHVFPVGVETDTLLHNLVCRDDLPAQSVKELIALFCHAGVKPDDCTSTGETPLTLLAHKKSGSIDHYRVVADTLVKVGTPIDYAFKQLCVITKMTKPAAASIIDAIQSSAYNAEKEVASVEKELQYQHNMLIATLPSLTNLSEVPAKIVADYACNLNPHDYFIEKILADTDTQLQKERQEREEREALAEQECSIM